MRPLVGPGLLAALVAGCQPVVRLELELVRDDGAAMAADTLHARVASACDPRDLAAPRATPPLAPPPGPGGGAPLELDGPLTRPRASWTFFEVRCLVQVTAWHDANANGLVDAGDALGSTDAPMVVDDSPTVGSPLRLAVVRGAT